MITETELHEIAWRFRKCPDLKPYVTHKGGVVLLNGPFPLDRAKCAEQFVKYAKEDVHRLIEEVLRLKQEARED